MHASVPVLATAFAGIVTAWPTQLNSTSMSASTWGNSVSASSLSSSATPSSTWGASVSSSMLSSSSATILSISASATPTPSANSTSELPHSTETLTTYTTLTTCPVTITKSSGPSAIVDTTWTTSITTVTSCIGGCHHTTPISPPLGTGQTPPVQPLSTGILPVPQPSGSGISPPPITFPPSTPITTTIISNVPSTTTITSVGIATMKSTITRFVPCSTLVATNAGSTYYSTFITPSYATTLLTVPTTVIQVICPITTPAGAVPTGNNEAAQFNPTTAQTYAPTTFYGPATGTCPPAQTIISTVIVLTTAAAPTHCAACETYTFTLPNGSPITTIITPSATPTHCAACKTSVYTLPNGIVTTTVVVPTTINGGGSGTTVIPPTPSGGDFFPYGNGTTVLPSGGDVLPYGTGVTVVLPTGTGFRTTVASPFPTGQGDVGLPPQVKTRGV